jgi:hypothetical protein
VYCRSEQQEAGRGGEVIEWMSSHHGDRYDADPGQRAGQGETSHHRWTNRVLGYLGPDRTQLEMEGGEGLTVRDRKPREQG